MADHGEHRQDRLDHHPLIPLSAPTQFEIDRIARRRMEGRVTQDHHLVCHRLDQGLKGVSGTLAVSQSQPTTKPN